MAGKGVQIGLSDLYYAVLTEDPSSGTATYETPVRIAGAISANINPNASTGTLFADNGPYDTATALGEINLEVNVADIPLEVQAVLFGHTISGGVLVRKANDVPPWVAIGFRALKSNGGWRYTWLAKGKFSLPEQTNQTKTDSVEFQTPTATGSFVRRDCDDEWERHTDTDTPDYVSSIGANWFNSPYGGSPDTSAPTVSVAPTNSATSVAVDVAVVWTFNEALALSTINTGNFLLFADSAGTAVAGELTTNAGRTVVTFTPSSNLSNSTAYRAVVTLGAKNLAGIPLASPSVTKFTTVSS